MWFTDQSRISMYFVLYNQTNFRWATMRPTRPLFKLHYSQCHQRCHMISPSQQIVSEGDSNNCIVLLKGKPMGQKKRKQRGGSGGKARRHRSCKGNFKIKSNKDKFMTAYITCSLIENNKYERNIQTKKDHRWKLKMKYKMWWRGWVPRERERKGFYQWFKQSRQRASWRTACSEQRAAKADKRLIQAWRVPLITDIHTQAHT